ncbi:MAG: hypothetical protein M0Z77_10465 [Thermoplasmatales archaeon]|jgi:hypothetical protein|nr:hypothetical protein [Candidatus Thermoplasmatota archaeon]MCL6003372.1 hypothetical protein [Candidatus Thermoplasmatota archaeon]MDA8056050.1 hypothetical protein [Thermoplasmatales archaeon]
MAITGLVVAKGLAVAAGVAGTTIAAAHVGNVIGLTNALQHVPTWTHAHTVISSLIQKR